jgi:acid phosphatase type 7
MTTIQRRDFLKSTLGGMTSMLALGASRWAAPASAEELGPTLVGNSGYDPSTLFLTWQRDPTTSITAQWIAPETPSDTAVSFRPLAGSASQAVKAISKPYSSTDLRVHRAELTNLEPDTEYQFQIGTNSPIYRFRTMPAKATNTIDFVTGGDSGIGEHAIANNILAAKQEPRFVLMAGDLAYDNGKSPETFLQFLRNYRAHMVDPAGRLIPMIACIGNHEVDGSYGQERSDSPNYLSVFDGFYSERTFGVFDVGDYLSLVLLDTDHIASVEGEQTDWLARTLAERQDRPHLIVANHVPAYPSYRPPFGEDGKGATGADQRQHWSPLFERYKVDVVLEHHDHTFKRTHPLTDGLKDKNGVLYLGDGSWGKLRSPKSPEERPYLAAVDEAYHISVHRLEGPRQIHVALEDTGKVADVAITESKRPSRRG